MGEGSPYPSNGRPPPPRQPTLLETHAPALGFKPWDPRELQYDWWEKEFIQHCCKTYEKSLTKDRAWFMKKGFRPHMLDRQRKKDQKDARRRKIENIRHNGRIEYKRQMEQGFPQLKQKRNLGIKILLISIIGILLIVLLVDYLPSSVFMISCVSLQWVAIIAFIFIWSTVGDVPRCPECMSTGFKQRFMSSYKTCDRCGYREKVVSSGGWGGGGCGNDSGGGGCCG